MQSGIHRSFKLKSLTSALSAQWHLCLPQVALDFLGMHVISVPSSDPQQ
jgi:hypothetical protein